MEGVNFRSISGQSRAIVGEKNELESEKATSA